MIKHRRYCLIRSLISYLVQNVLCFLLLGGLVIELFFMLFGLSYLPGFWVLFLSNILGFTLSLGVDYRKAPPISCLPFGQLKLKNTVGPERRVPNRTFFALHTKDVGFFWGRKRNPVFWLLFSLLGGFCVIIFSNLLAQVLTTLFPQLPTFQMRGVEEIFARLSLWQAFLIIVLVPAIFEELAFRGRGFALLGRSWGERGTIIVSSIIFASVHASPVEIISILPLAFYLGWLRYRTGNLAFSMLVHLQNNGIAFLWYTLIP